MREQKHAPISAQNSVDNVEDAGNVGIGRSTKGAVRYFNWKDGNNGWYYPIPGDNSVTYPNPPDVAIAYSEIFDGESHGRLSDKYFRIDFEFCGYDTKTGKAYNETYTWMRDGSGAGDATVTRDTRFDNLIGKEDVLLFSIPDFSGFATPYIQVDDCLGHFHYIDSLGHSQVEDIFAVYISDDSK